MFWVQEQSSNVARKQREIEVSMKRSSKTSLKTPNKSRSSRATLKSSGNVKKQMPKTPNMDRSIQLLIEQLGSRNGVGLNLLTEDFLQDMVQELQKLEGSTPAVMLSGSGQTLKIYLYIIAKCLWQIQAMYSLTSITPSLTPNLSLLRARILNILKQ